MKALITGGCKNGKSFYAQQLIMRLGGIGDKYYIATMKPSDDEDLERIKRHRRERADYGFITIEQQINIAECINKCDAKSSILLDSTTALLANEMFPENGRFNLSAHEKIAGELLRLCRRVENIAIVSDYIYSDAQIYDDLSESYRFSLAYIDKALAKECDTVCEVSFSNKIFHKGGALV